MRPHYYLFCFLLLSLGGQPIPSLAQGIYYLPAPTAAAPLPAATMYVARVFDARAQRTSLGRVPLNTSQLAVPTTFRQGLTPVLQAFYDQQAPGQPGARPLLLRLLNLEVGVAPGATATVVADFYTPRPDSSYQLVARFADLISQPTGWLTNSTKHLPDVLGELLLKSLTQARNPAAWLAGGPSFSAAYVLDPAPHPAEVLPVLAADFRPRPGFYHSLREFWLNAPSEPGSPEVETHAYLGTEWAGDVASQPFRRRADGRREAATDAWGFSDGQDFYLHVGESFYRLTRRGVGFTFYGQLGDDPTYQAIARANTRTSFFYGGLVGAAMNGVSTPSDKRRVLFGFDPLTGGTSLDPSTATVPLATRPTHLFVYRPRGDKGPPVRIRLAEDQPARELAAGDYLTFEPSEGLPVQVCLRTADSTETHFSVLPTAEAPTYLECRATAATPLRLIPDATGASALNRLAR